MSSSKYHCIVTGECFEKEHRSVIKKQFVFCITHGNSFKASQILIPTEWMNFIAFFLNPVIRNLMFGLHLCN